MKKLMKMFRCDAKASKSKGKKSHKKNCLCCSKAYLLGGLLVLLVALGLYLSFDDIAERELEKFNVPPSPIESSDLTGSLRTVTNSDLPNYRCSDGSTQTMGTRTPNVDSGHYFLFHVNNDTTLNNALASIKKDNSNYIIVGYDETLPGSFASPYKFVEYLSDFYEGTQRDNLNSTIKAGTVFVVQSLNRNDVCNRTFEDPTFRKPAGLNLGWYLAAAPQGFKDGRITKAYASSDFFSPTDVTLDETNGLPQDGYYWFKVDFTRNASDPMNGGASSGDTTGGDTSRTTGGRTMGCSSVANSQGTFGSSDLCGGGTGSAADGGNGSGTDGGTGSGGDQPVEFSFDYTNNSLEQGQAYNYLSNANNTFVANGVEQAQAGIDSLGSLIGGGNVLVSNNDFVKVIDFKFDAVRGSSNLTKLDLIGLGDYLDKAVVYLDDTLLGEYSTGNLDFADLTLDNTLNGKSLYVYLSLKPALENAPLSPTVLASMDAYIEPIAISGNSTINYVTKSSTVSNPNRFLVSLGGDDQERKIGSYEISLNQVANILADADFTEDDSKNLTRDSLNLYAIKGQLANADDWFRSMSAKIYVDGQATQVSVPMELTATGFESKINFKTLASIKRAVRLNNFDTQSLKIDFYANSFDNPPVESSEVLIDLYLDSAVNQISTQIQKATSFEANGVTHAYAYSSIDVMSPFDGAVNKLVNFVTTPLTGFEILSNTQFNPANKRITDLSSKSVDYLTFFYDIDSLDSSIPADAETTFTFVNKVGDVEVETDTLVEYTNTEIDGNMLTSSISFKKGLEDSLYDLTTTVAGVELPETIEVSILDSETNLTSTVTKDLIAVRNLDQNVQEFILLDLEGEYNNNVEVYELRVSLTTESSSDIIESIYLDLPEGQSDIALNKIEGSNVYSISSSLLADSDEYHFNPSLKTSSLENFMYPLVVKLIPFEGVDRTSDHLEIDSIELITNSDLTIFVQEDNLDTPINEEILLEDVNQQNILMNNNLENRLFGFSNQVNDSKSVANISISDHPGFPVFDNPYYLKIGTLKFADFVRDFDYFRFENSTYNTAAINVRLMQGATTEEFSFDDQNYFKLYTNRDTIDFSSDLDVEVEIGAAGLDGEGVHSFENNFISSIFSYFIPSEGGLTLIKSANKLNDDAFVYQDVLIATSVSVIKLVDSELEFTYTPDNTATVDNIGLDVTRKIGDIALTADPVLDSDLPLSLSFASNASFVSSEYQYCLDLDSSDDVDPICFEDPDPDADGTYELDFTFTAQDLEAELLVKRVAEPQDESLPFSASNQSFEITVDSNYVEDGVINVTGVNIQGVTPVDQP